MMATRATHDPLSLNLSKARPPLPAGRGSAAPRQTRNHTAAGATYGAKRQALETYFDATAQQAWIDLTSDAPVSKIRATVRAGRDRMRETLLSWLPEDLRRARILDAGCGTGALAIAAAWRGAQVVAVDVAAGLVAIGEERGGGFYGHGSIAWHAGDMIDPAHGEVDHAIAMDSLIHYSEQDLIGAVTLLAARTRRSILFTFPPRTPLLAAMHASGRLFPKSERSPALQPMREKKLVRALGDLPGWALGRSTRVQSGFYTSHALELVRR